MIFMTLSQKQLKKYVWSLKCIKFNYKFTNNLIENNVGNFFFLRYTPMGNDIIFYHNSNFNFINFFNITVERPWSQIWLIKSLPTSVRNSQYFHKYFVVYFFT